MDGDVSLEGDADRHEDGPAHGHALGGVQQVREEQCVQFAALKEKISKL